MIFPSRKLNRFGGTTLIEVLVVIVVFLVGILAIAQIFPGGIKILNRSRNNSMAIGLLRSEQELLKSRPDVIPGEIVPIRMTLVGGVYVPIEDPTWLPTEYSPAATGIDQSGIALGTGRAWQLVSGANTTRRVIGETHKITAPKLLSPDGTSVTAPFGSLSLLEFGPIDHVGGIQLPGQLNVYGRDMYRIAANSSADYSGLRDYEYAVMNMTTSAAEIAFPAVVPGRYRVSLTATIISAGTTFTRRINGQLISIAAAPSGFGVVAVNAIPGVLGGGENLVGVEVDSLKIAHTFTQLAPATAFSATDLFQYKVLNGRVGELLFNPSLFGKYEERSGATRQPYVARIDYDVRDWRILHEDFRISTSNPAGLPKVLKLAVPSLRTNSVAQADGLRAPSHSVIIAGADAPNAGMEDVFVVNNTVVPGANTTDADNMLVIDVATGGQLLESFGGKPTMRVDKSNGYLTLFDIDNDDTNGLTQAIAMPDGSVVQTNVTGRLLRTYYMAREDWAIQVTRSAAHYDFTYTTPAAAQYYVGGTGLLNGSTTRIYFPAMDTNRKVSIGKIRYVTAGGAQQTLEGAEFQVKFRKGADSITQSMPSIDLKDIDSSATSFLQDTTSPASMAYSVADVRGVSVISKAFYNNGGFALSANTLDNLNNKFSNWAKEWGVSSRETYLHRGEAIQ
jgi:type II secretory pathway pseudopilin PulG